MEMYEDDPASATPRSGTARARVRTRFTAVVASHDRYRLARAEVRMIWMVAIGVLGLWAITLAVRTVSGR